ncbi:SDR family oxidoreductase [Tistrella mobilis]
MHLFVTGATGFVGTAVVRDLLGAGHRVSGLARSDEAAAALARAGVTPIRGDLRDTAGLAAAAAAADGVIHAGFIHDFTDYVAHCETDRAAVRALGAALAGTDRPLIVTSGIGVLPQGRLCTEDDAPRAGAGALPRVASEEAAAEVLAAGARVMVLRLPPSVHGAGDHGFVPMLIDIARRSGASAWIGEGANLWPAVHRSDAARLYRLALEAGQAGARYHAVAEQGIAFRDVATAIGEGLGLPLRAVTPEEAPAHFTWFTHFAAMDVPASATITRDSLGWVPTGPGLLHDIRTAGYFGEEAGG